MIKEALDVARDEADRWAAERKKLFPTLNPASFDNERAFIIMGFLAGVAWKECCEVSIKEKSE